MSAVLALDLGGTVLKAGVVDESGTVLSTTTRPSCEERGVEAWVASALEAAAEAIERSPVEPVALGLSVPGAVDVGARRLVDLVDRLPSDGIDLAAAFAPLGLPVAADNDAKAALAAELRWGGLRDVGNLVVLTIGTGIGSAALIGGSEPGGDPVLAGNQLGHVTLELDGKRCICGNFGCAETVASATAMVDSARAVGLDVGDAAGVFAARDAGDPEAGKVITRFVRALAATVVNAIHAYQPDAVVLTGGVMARADQFLPAVRGLVAERAWTLPRNRVRVEVSTLGPAAGVLAGAAVALRQVQRCEPSKCRDK
jgi:glucokinase